MDLELLYSVAVWFAGADLVLWIIIVLINYARRRKLGLVKCNLEDVKKEVKEELCQLEDSSAFKSGVSSYQLECIKRTEYIWDVVITLAGIGYRLELVPVVEGVTDSVECSGRSNEDFRREVQRVYIRQWGDDLFVENCM